MTPCEVVPGPTESYATVWLGGGGTYIYAHRKAYEEAHGAIPDGFDVHHTCGVRRCVNPDHLEAVSHADHPRRHRRDCGHDPSELRPTGRRREFRCRACQRELMQQPQWRDWKRQWQRDYRAKKRALA